MHDKNTGGDANYEMTDVKAKMAVIAGIFCSVLCLFAFVLGFFIMKYFTVSREAMSEHEVAKTGQGESQWESDLRLQSDMPTDYAAHDEAQQAPLTQFDVISEAPAIYQVPVETALEWVVEDGLPTFKDLPTVINLNSGE